MRRKRFFVKRILSCALATIFLTDCFCTSEAHATELVERKEDVDIINNTCFAGTIAVVDNIMVTTPEELTTADNNISVVASSEEPAEPAAHRPSDDYSAEELNLMANIVWQESRGESRAGQVAVAEVILNRVASPSFPGTVTEVVSQNNQFSSYKIASRHGTADPYFVDLCINVINGDEHALNNPNVLYFKRYDGSKKFNKADFFTQIQNHAFYAI